VELTHVFRQEDKAFVKVLNEVRTGQVSHETIQALGNCRGPPQGALKDGVALTRLYPHNVSAHILLFFIHLKGLDQRCSRRSLLVD
jgi:hypothetical protein